VEDRGKMIMMADPTSKSHLTAYFPVDICLEMNYLSNIIEK